MGLFHFLIVVQGIFAAILVVVILMQRSEGGGLGTGGSPSGLMSARGAADFMTRTTTFLAVGFIGTSIALAFVAAQQGNTTNVDESFKRTEATIQGPDALQPSDAAAKIDPAAKPSAPKNNPAPATSEIPVDK
jgi:preprotein translocase subunit SecG